METLSKAFPLLLNGTHNDCRAFKYRQVEVVCKHTDQSWPGKRYNVDRWVSLANMIAVGETEDCTGKIKYVTLKIPAKMLCDCHRQEMEIRQTGMVKVTCNLPEGSIDPYGNPIKTERLWAVPVGRNRCRIANIPFFVLDIGQHDIVETTGSGFERAFVAIKEKRTNTVRVAYKAESQEELVKAVKTMYEYFENGEPKIEMEPGGVGFVSLAIPVEMTENQWKKRLENCPVDGEIF